MPDAPTTEAILHIPGSDLRVGDTLVSRWWDNGRDTITAFEPYTGIMAPLIGDCARVARLASGAPMTIWNDDMHHVVARTTPEPAPGIVGESLACLGFLMVLAAGAFALIATA